LTNTADEEGSQLILGGVDSEYYSGSLSYVPLISENYYLISIDHVYIGSQNFDVGSMKGIVDSGTSLLVGTTSWVSKMLKVLPANPNCNDLSQYPDIIFTLGGNNFTIPASKYVLDVEG